MAEDKKSSKDTPLGVPADVIITIKGAELYQPIVLDGVSWETNRKGVPGKLTFTVVKDEVLNFHEGNEVNCFINGKHIFFGYVFTKSRDKDHRIKVVAYDQLRYLKNKFIYKYSGTATSLVKSIANDFYLRTGELADTKYSIPLRLEDNVTLFDMIQTALDLTFDATQQLYVLYDNCGRLELTNLTDMQLDLVIEPGTAENFDYSSSIDGQTYNSIQCYYEDGQKSKARHMPAPAQNKEHIAQWGLLQMLKKVDNAAAVEALQKSILKAYDRKTRTLRIRGAFGDVRVRGGSMLPVLLNVGDIIVKNYLIVERVEHRFEGGHHSMNMDLVGGDFVGQ